MSGARKFLFLQGPHGPFFRLLGAQLAAAGYAVERVNFNGGDRHDWPAGIDYRGRLDAWPAFIDGFLIDHAITDLVLFGDCRPLHKMAHGVARLRDIRVHVLEEGYLRPNFVTLEPDGVNGYSILPRDPRWLLAEARTLPPYVPVAAIPAPFRRRLSQTVAYASATFFKTWRYPNFRTHRPEQLTREAAGWLTELALRRTRQTRSARLWEAVRERRFVAVPLQLNSDYQVRVHSPFGDMRAALRYIVRSFARNGPDDLLLVVKRHPLDPGIVPWRRLVRRIAEAEGVADRVVYLHDADIDDVVGAAQGVVTVNSTVGTLALNRGIPVAVIGQAIYAVPGIVADLHLDRFWAAPVPPDLELYEAFRRVMIDRCLIAGGFLSDEGVAMLVTQAAARLTKPAVSDNVIPLDRAATA